MAVDFDATTILDRLRAAVRASGLKQDFIARNAGITAATLSRILTGRTSDPSLAVVLRICDAIDVPPAAIFGERPSKLTEADRDTLRRFIAFAEQLLREDAARPLFAAAELADGSIPRRFHDRGARIVVVARGESLAQDGIHDGDRVYVRPSRSLRLAAGQLVLCRVNGILQLRRITPQDAPLPNLDLLGIVVGLP